MKSSSHDNFVLLKDEHNDIVEFAEFLPTIWQQFSSKNVIVDLSEYDQATLNQLLHFLELSNKHRATKQSFVIINKALSIDQIPEELMVVPTLQEAQDIIEMEEIERDLGF
ncbi:MAG: ribonuclease Z [Bacteroidota bacterium]|uniref:ribonuclease Z n=1 Tax=Nonlabens tegetincola TaxID=323273 RepID=UPI000A2031F3|nr:ribonuclease Z [Nonlabens tegetincola]ARN70820.1 ribonuclease Z [Nonlabens tegetincola]MEE2802263.1 ribonuclease Z [Bacteroidota bacterium]